MRMTSDRPYRKALPHEQAVREIAQHAGTQFDSAVVEAFLRVMAHPEEAQGQAPQPQAGRQAA